MAASSSSKLVLIAEDDKYLANIYRSKITNKGYDVVIARDGEETVKLVGEKKPDLIILDLLMPNKDGFYVLEKLKKDSKLAKIPIVVISNLGQNDDVQKAEKMGISEYIVKTDISLEEILKKIETYLK